MTDLAWPAKDPADVWDYSLDAREWMASVGDTLTAATATITPAGLTLISTAVTAAGIATVRLAGGTAGITYSVELTLSTAGGRTLQRTVTISARDQ
jgi:hypothetical protein